MSRLNQPLREMCARHPHREKAWKGAVGCRECCDRELKRAVSGGRGPNEGCPS